jgi:predicted alpha/beta-fold hydrolase
VLDTWSAEKWTNGLQIDELDQLETLSVETMNHTYEITIINPATAEVMVRGGDFFPERTLAQFSGASFGGSFLKRYGIYAGLKMEFRAGGKRIITSPVRRIGLVTAD